MSKSDYTKPRTNLFELLPEVYKSGVNESVLETTVNRFLSKTEIERKIGYVGQGNPKALVNRQIEEPTPHRQAFQLQPIIFSQIGTIEHMASSEDILNEVDNLGVDVDRMKEWGDALSFNWAPPIDYDKLINFGDYFWQNLDDLSDPRQYVTIQNLCTRAEAQLDEYENTKSQFGVEHDIVGLNSSTNTITIDGDLTQLFTEGFIFFVKDSTNSSINNEFFVTVSSSRPPGLDRTNIIVEVTGSPGFNDTPVDGVVSLEELTEVFATQRDCVCSGELGWDGGLWDDNQIGDVIWNTELLTEITFETEADWITANGTPTEFDLWYDTSTDTLKQCAGGSPCTFVVVQNNFSTILDATSGGEFWDLSQQCQELSELNVWQEQNKWVHKNQVVNFTLARQAQIPIIEFLPTVQLNEWAETTYQWQYRAEPAIDDFEDTTATPNLFELIGVVNDPSSPSVLGFTVLPGSPLDELVLDSKYGDLTDVFVPGYQFNIQNDTTDLSNNTTYTVDVSLYCEQVKDGKLQTQIKITTSLASITNDGTMVPVLTSLGDTFVGLFEHWVFAGVIESVPVDRQPENPQTAIPFNPPPTASQFTSGSPPVVLGEYVLSNFAQEVTFSNTDSFGTIAVVGVSTGSPNAWTLSGNHATVFNDSQFGIIGSTLVIQDNSGGGANGQYTIVSATDVAGNTDVVVAENIAVTATADGNGFVYWTFTFDSSLHDQTRFNTNELRVYLQDVRQYGSYTEINAGAATVASPLTPPGLTSCDDFVNSILIQTPIEKFDSLLIEVGAAAGEDVGLENVTVRIDASDAFTAPTDLVCVSLVRYRKLEQDKVETNQYPLFDLFDVEGETINRASRVFAFEESQQAPIDEFFGRRIVHSPDRRVYNYEQFLLDEDDGPIYAYRDTDIRRTLKFWFDTDNEILYNWTGDTWDPKILTAEFASSTGSPLPDGCYLTPIVSDEAPGSPFIDIDGMIWFNTNNDTINVSDGTTWVEDSAFTAATTLSATDPTLQTIWRTGPEGVDCDQREIYVPSYVDEDRNPVLHHTIVEVSTGSPGTWTIYDERDAENILGAEVPLINVGDVIQVNGNLDTNSNKQYTVLDLTEVENDRTVIVEVATIPGTATISGHMIRVGDADADWEVPDQLFFNNSHENRKKLTSTDLLAHFQTIIGKQEVPPGLFGDSTTMYHALVDINFGVGGTIKEYNDSYDTFISSIFSQVVNPLVLYEYAHDAYETALNLIKEFYRAEMNTLMTDTDEEAVADQSGDIADDLIAQYEQNDFQNFVYGDSNTFDDDTGLGVRHWPATLPFTRMGFKVEPILVDDDSLDLNGLRHHDGHLSQVGFLSTSLNQFANRIVNTDDTRGSNPSGKMGTTQTAGPPDDYADYSAIFGNTSACYWFDTSSSTRVLYRMSAVRVSGETAPPSVSLPVGTFWYDLTNDRLKVLEATSGSPSTNSWVNATTAFGKLTEGSVSAWEVTDINQILAEVFLELETRLFQAAPDLDELAFDFVGTFANSPDLTAQYYQDSFFAFLKQAGITQPFTNFEFDADDPFTWNYKTSAAGSPVTNPRVGQAYISGGTWQDVYKKNYGTPYPHIEPWTLQGYTSRPTWWNSTYQDTTGTRRWQASMWRRVLDGIVPTGEFLPNGSISTGAAGEVQEYNYVSVNIDDETHDDVAPDELFAPFFNFVVTPTGSPIFTTDEVRSIFTTMSEIDNPDADYEYDDAGLVEWLWENSSQFLYDSLKVAFRLQPVRFIQQTLGEPFLEISCLQISQALQNVYAHQNARFHGDLLDDNTVLKLQGTLQWYVNFNRFSGYDTSSSNFRPMWTNWTTPLGYLFATFIDTESFIVFNLNFDITTQDFEVRVKKSPGIQNMWVEAFDVTVLQAPPEYIRRDTESQWVFNFNTTSPIGRTINYYASKSYNFTVDTAISPAEVLDTMTVVDEFGRDLDVEDGDPVIVSSSEFLPSPLMPDTQYFINVLGPTSFSLSEQKNGPVIDILSEGSGTQTVSSVARSFTALDGEATDDKIWYIYNSDRNLVLELTPPETVVGMETAINIIAHYAEYEEVVENFSFNHQITDIDPETNRVVDWQLEIEKLIVFSYGFRTESQRRRNSYEWEVGTSSPVTLLFKETSEVNDNGQVVTSVDAPAWTTGTAIRLFTSEGGVLPDPFLENTLYYVIRLSKSEFQLALTSKNARNGIAIEATSSGSGTLFIQESIALDNTPSIEVNPFRSNLFVNTPQGIVSDLSKGPFPDVRTEELVFDQFGRPLPISGVLALRQDLQTRITIQDGIANDVSPSFEPGTANFLHLASAHIFIDGYEHVVLFNNYATGGELIYDPFIGLNTPKFDVLFDRFPEFTLRPNVGGYTLLNLQNVDFTTSLIRNTEGQTEDLRFAYDTYNVLEVNDLVQEGRASLGYDGPFDFLSAINVNPKSQFIFWRGLIQHKGSVNSIKAFINSRRFVDAKVDEFWAYQVAEFGDNAEVSLPEVNLFTSDTTVGDIRFHFVDSSGAGDQGFIEVLPNDLERWFERPNQQEFFDLRGNMYFNVGIESIDVTPSDFFAGASSPGIFYIELPVPADGVIVVDSSGVVISEGASSSPLVGSPPLFYTRINARTLEFNGTGTLTIFLATPFESKHNPCKIRDAIDEITVAEAILWDPARNNHYHNAIHLVDIQRDDDAAATDPDIVSPVVRIYEFDIDPATGTFVDQDATTFNPWGSSEVNTTWMDTNELGWVPYSDVVIFPSILDRLKFWGRLSDWASYRLYQWTESSVVPDEYDALAEEQEGNFSIDPQIRVTGRVRKVTYINSSSGSPRNWVEYPFEKYQIGSRLYFNDADAEAAFTQPNLVDGNLDAVGSPAEIPQFRAYRDGIEFIGANADQDTGDYFGNTLALAIDKFEIDLVTDYVDSDTVTLVKFFPTDDDIDDTFWLQGTPYDTENAVVNDELVTKYFFWVENKTTTQVWRKKNISMVEAEQQLETIPLPYVVPQNLQEAITGSSPSSEERPRRYTQAILRNYGTLINADGRYILRFTRNFVIRDDLRDTADGHLLRTQHQEWEIFRREQPFNVARVLWDTMTEAIIGQTLASLGATAVRVPSLNRELYDVENNNSTRIGIAQEGQAFCDGQEGWDAILQYLQDGNNDFFPIDIQEFTSRNDILNLTPRDPNDAQAIADALDEIYNTFTFINVNNIFFLVFETAALSFQVKYEDIFKTSWVALHGIKILETNGIFDD